MQEISVILPLSPRTEGSAAG